MKLVVAVNNTECSKNTVKHLRLSGLSMGAFVKFVHVMPPGTQATEVSVCINEVVSPLTNAQSTEIYYAEGDNIAERVLDIAADWEADLIVVGTSDKSGLERLLLGSVSRSILSDADRPVLVLRGEPAPIDKVLVAADDSENSAASLEWLSNQHWARMKKLALLSVMDEPPIVIESEFSSADSAQETLLKKQAEEVRVAQLSQAWSDLCAANLKKKQIPFVVTDGQPTEAILALSKGWDVDLVVLGSQCRSGLDKVLNGSVSETVAHDARCSVLVVRDVRANMFEEIRMSLTVSVAISDPLIAQPARVYASLTVEEFSARFPG